MKRISWVIIFLGAVGALALVFWLFSGAFGPLKQSDMSQPRVYAYRDWQSVGIQVHSWDTLYIRAEGTWLYTPGEYHGPEGHRTYLSPDTYPINAVPGGVLIGRFGKDGEPFYVGRGGTFVADREGFLYLRINDDILSDNEGYVTVEVEVTPAEESSTLEEY
ncbi:MAG: hypothetical protein JXA21_21590 [Anaerolineae bacterium]|nr:hypothetical protein [Anaerolineae bacterium]